MNAQTIVISSGERLVVLPEADFDALMAAAEDASDAAAVETFRHKLAAGEEELVPAEVVDRILAGESRVRVWREHRGLDDVSLAGAAGLEAGSLGEIEAGTRGASVEELRRIAAALGVTPDDLADRQWAQVRPFVAGTEEGEPIQKRLIERGPVPTIVSDGWEVEQVEDGKVRLVLYTEHTRDDGQSVRIVQSRLVMPQEAWGHFLREIEEARRKWRTGQP